MRLTPCRRPQPATRRLAIRDNKKLHCLLTLVVSGLDVRRAKGDLLMCDLNSRANSRQSRDMRVGPAGDPMTDRPPAVPPVRLSKRSWPLRPLWI